MKPTKIIRVDEGEESVGCNGGGGALGHPMVYLLFDGKPSVDCYYCSRHFAKPAYFERHEQAGSESEA